MLSILALTAMLSGAPARAQEATQKYTKAELDASPYLKSLVTRERTMADDSKFKKKAPYKIALAAQGPTNSWAALFDQEARYHVDQLGKDKISELLYASADGSADKQAPEVEDLLSQNPDALILVPMGRAALAAPVDRAAAQGVPVVLCASGVDSDSYVTEVGTNLYDVGVRMANWLSDQLGGKGDIVVMDGIPGVDTAETGKAGAASVWPKKPGIKILDEQYGQWSTSEAKKIAEQWVAKYGKNIQGVWSDGGQMSQGIIEAFQEAKLPVPPIASADYSNGFLRQVKEGGITFFAGQYPNAMVILCIDTALKILNGEPTPRFIDFRDKMDKTQDVNKSNIDTFFNPKWSDDVFPPIFLP
ncbi:MAG: substrate-binding domain-containing protein, partial [Hyphomicrobiales bacterium]|nr:substrate-binding domain-containing protein [Hyphomicrobiales bacterium]